MMVQFPKRLGQVIPVLNEKLRGLSKYLEEYLSLEEDAAMK